MSEDLYIDRIRAAAESITTTWATPSAEPPPVVEWLVAQYADLYVRQTRHPNEGRAVLAEAWADLRGRLLDEVRRVVNRRSDGDWVRTAAEHDERVEAAERELRRVTIAPYVAALNALTATHIESLASALDAGLPIEVVLEASAREVGVAMLIASLGIDAGGAVEGATETMRGVLRREAEKLVAARTGE